MKIAFLWEWAQAREIYPNWRDGLRAAIELLEKEHEVEWCFNEPPTSNPDWILTWCDSNSQLSRFFSKYPAKRGIFLTTHPSNYHNLLGFDVVFCETSVIYDECRMRGVHAVRAFGTDEQFFTPGKVKKDLAYFYPATFSPWKKQEDIAHLGNKLTCIGTIQPDGEYQYQVCKENGVNTEVGYFPPEKIRDYYQRTRNIVIPAVHGSERTVLEAMSCDLLPIVISPQNIRASSYIKEFQKSGLISPREFILKNYSAEKYKQSILKGMKDVS